MTLAEFKQQVAEVVENYSEIENFLIEASTWSDKDEIYYTIRYYTKTLGKSVEGATPEIAILNLKEKINPAKSIEL